MTFYSIPPLTCSVLVMFVGIFVFSKNRKSTVNLTFFFLTVGILLWLSGYSILYQIENKSTALSWAKFLYLGVIFLPTFSHHFLVAFLNINSESKIIKSRELNYKGELCLKIISEKGLHKFEYIIDKKEPLIYDVKCFNRSGTLLMHMEVISADRDIPDKLFDIEPTGKIIQDRRSN